MPKVRRRDKSTYDVTKSRVIRQYRSQIDGRCFDGYLGCCLWRSLSTSLSIEKIALGSSLERGCQRYKIHVNGEETLLGSMLTCVLNLDGRLLFITAIIG
eukprot:scaffold2268_cov188-Alexandrium_tamarense.AAC.21